MTSGAAIGNYPLLMVDSSRGHVFPFASRGFRALASPPVRAMMRVAGTLFLGPDGQVRTITDIALADASLWNRLKVRAGLRVPATVSLEDTTLTSLAFTTILLDALARHRAALGRHRADWWLFGDAPAVVQSRITAAPDLRHLYADMRFPPLKNCLDLL